MYILWWLMCGTEMRLFKMVSVEVVGVYGWVCMDGCVWMGVYGWVCMGGCGGSVYMCGAEAGI